MTTVLHGSPPVQTRCTPDYGVRCCLFLQFVSFGSGLDSSPGVVGQHAPRYGIRRRGNTTVQEYDRPAINVSGVILRVKTGSEAMHCKQVAA